jgi:hypothetical protein
LISDLNKTDISLYYTDTCPACQQQNELFEGSFDDLKNTINCSSQSCEVEYVPTWDFGDGNQETGVKTLEELRSIVDSL